ncbi:MAG: hypothetical protein ACHQHO_01895 [Solirubrobacterales bacterium]
MSDRNSNVVLAPGSAAHRATHPPAAKPSDRAPTAELAEGFEPPPEWNLKAEGGRTTQLVQLDFNGLRWPHVTVATLHKQ